MQGKYVTAANKKTWYSSYYAANPAKDGRKVFRNHQTGVVQQMEAPGSRCISRGGGHTEALLQALDDRGRIVGLVGVEASLSQQRSRPGRGDRVRDGATRRPVCSGLTPVGPEVT